MRILTSRWKRSVDLLAVGAGWVAARNGDHYRGGLELLPLHGGAPLRPDLADEPVYGAAIDLAGRLFVSNDAGLCVLDLASGQEGPPPGPTFYRSDFGLSTDGTRLLASHSLNENGALSACERQPDGTYSEYWREGWHAFLWFDAPTLSPDGQLAAVAQRSPGDGMRGVHIELVVRHTTSSSPLCKITLDKVGDWRALRITDGGLLLGLAKRGVTVWDGRSGRQIAILRNPVRKMLIALAVHPSGKWFATTDSMGTVRYWDLAAFQQTAALAWQVGRLESIAFAPDGTIAAAGTADGRVVVWDVDV